MKRQSLTKCLQLAHNFNDQEVIDLISSKYRVAKVVVAKINVPPMPSTQRYRLKNISNIFGGRIDDVIKFLAESDPSNPLLGEGSLADKIQEAIKHCELWDEYVANTKSSSPTTRSNAEKIYAEKYKAEVDPSWEVGELDEFKNPEKDPGDGEKRLMIHEYIKHAMEKWYESLDAKTQSGQGKLKVGEDFDPSRAFYTWWKELKNLYADNNRVLAALNATHTVYLEPESYADSEASTKMRIITSELDTRYSRMLQEKVSLFNLGLEENEFPYFGPTEILFGEEKKKVIYHNPERQNLDNLISELQDALLGIVKKEPKKPDTTDYTKGLKLISNLMGYKAGRV